MQETSFEQILKQMAKTSSLSQREIRDRMQLAMDVALADPSPTVQAMWKTVPKKAEVPTLDEFMEYLIDKNMLAP